LTATEVLGDEDTPSLGAMIGNRNDCFPDISLLLFDITMLVTVITPHFLALPAKIGAVSRNQIWCCV
jgi:hypothetical protein